MENVGSPENIENTENAVPEPLPMGKNFTVSELHPILEYSKKQGDFCRILRPVEYEAIIKAFVKYKLKFANLPAVLLSTGMRYVELKKLNEHPEWHIYDEKIIDPKGLHLNDKLRQKGFTQSRVIYLSDYGNERVKTWLNRPDRYVPSRVYFDIMMNRLSEQAGLRVQPRTIERDHYILTPEGKKIKDKEKGGWLRTTSTITYNTTGVSEKSFRKTWVSWLMTMYPQFEPRITASFGHSPDTSRKYYQSYRFSDHDVEMMERYVKGFVPERLLK